MGYLNVDTIGTLNWIVLFCLRLRPRRNVKTQGDGSCNAGGAGERLCHRRGALKYECHDHRCSHA